MEKKLVRMKLADLVPYDNNPRRNEEAVEATIASMQQCGNIDPIEVDENRVILSGHTRRLALLKMGYEESDVVVVTGLTDAQKKKYRLLANKTNEFAGWDMDKLAEELDGLDFEGFDFGFDLGNGMEPENLDAPEDYDGNGVVSCKLTFSNYTAFTQWEQDIKDIAYKANATFAMVK